MSKAAQFTLAQVDEFDAVAVAEWLAVATSGRGAIDGIQAKKTDSGLPFQRLYSDRTDVIEATKRGSGRWQVAAVVDSVNATAIDSQVTRAIGLSADALWFARSVPITAIDKALVAQSAGRLPVIVDSNGPEAADDDLIDRVSFLWDPLACRLGSGGWRVAQYRADILRIAQTLKRSRSENAAFAADGRLYHEAGATPVQELAYTIATCIDHLRHLEQLDFKLDALTRRMAVVLSAGRDLFVEIAKHRAFRVLWRQLERAMGQHANGEFYAPRLHSRTSKRTKTQIDPWVNVIRSTTEAFAAATGGADVVAVGGFDEACSESSVAAERLAHTTQLILMREAQLGRVDDPGCGSGYIESTTAELARRSWALVRRIEKCGGMRQALADGMITEELDASWKARTHAIDSGELPIVGVTLFPPTGDRFGCDARVVADGELPIRRDAAVREIALRASVQDRSS